MNSTQSSRSLTHEPAPMVSKQDTSSLVLGVLMALSSGASAAETAVASREASCPASSGEHAHEFPLIIIRSPIILLVLMLSIVSACAGAVLRDRYRRYYSRDVSSQAQCTYTAVRGASRPRFLPLPDSLPCLAPVEICDANAYSGRPGEWNDGW